MRLENRFNAIQNLLPKLIPFLNAQDADAIKGNAFQHKWIQDAIELSEENKVRFDAKREFDLIQDAAWTETINTIKQLSSFPQSSKATYQLKVIGKQKKQHEFQRLYNLLATDKNKKTVDFGGGVGNLAYFLEQNLKMDVNVLEQNQELIKKGLLRSKRNNFNANFTPVRIEKLPVEIDSIKESQLAIGLHTCGNFTTNMLRNCVHNHAPKIINFGCCYSKIENNDYNLCQLSNKNLHFNGRALSAATLGFSQIDKDRYYYRLKIMRFKFTFYHFLYQKYGVLTFFSMSNARRSLYNLSFTEFAYQCLKKFYPSIQLPESEELEAFYQSTTNQKLLEYFRAYYAIQRYFGELLEVYLLCDRALYLQDQGYDSQILSVFDPQISPRNKAIIANYRGV